MNWIADRHPNYQKLDGYRDALVRTKPTANGRYLWQFGQTYDYAATIEEAREMVEGLAVGTRPTPSKPQYTVVEFAGYEGENDARSFDTYREASEWMRATYDEDEREEMHVDIRKDYPDGEQSYDF